jgi:tetratricopeptide (TPR) repeat protein
VLAWGIPELVKGRKGEGEKRRAGIRRIAHSPILPFSACIVLVALIVCTYIQVGYWRNTTSIFRRALAATRYNAVAHNTLGIELDGRGEADNAMAHYQRALEIKPDYANAHNNLAIALFRKGDYRGAWQHVELCRRYGGKPHPGFIEALKQRT